MKILLSPNSKKPDELRDVYNRALDDAAELCIASAYLTDWDATHKLGSACNQVTFVVGTDFGLTRKAAMLNVLRWIPKRVAFVFKAVPKGSGFHPKIVAWKTRFGKCYCIIGSSNLSRAGFSSNCEANVLFQIAPRDFKRLRAWIDSVAKRSWPVSKDWIENYYIEAAVTRAGGPAKATSIEIEPAYLPHGRACERTVLNRRRQQLAFKKIGVRIRVAARRCSEGKISRSAFWRRFWDLWAGHPSQLQGRGLEMTGKSAKWEESCGSLIRILDESKSSPTSQLDLIVAREIDHLKDLGNPTRGAWLSEMLCHYLPKLYPVNNMPVQKWLSAIKLRGRRGASEGQRYTELACKLRAVVRESHPAGARDLAELDGGIWQLAHDRGLLRRPT